MDAAHLALGDFREHGVEWNHKNVAMGRDSPPLCGDSLLVLSAVSFWGGNAKPAALGLDCPHRASQAAGHFMVGKLSEQRDLVWVPQPALGVWVRQAQTRPPMSDSR